MSEDCRSFLAGVFAGFLAVIFLQLSAVTLGLRKIAYKKKHADIYHRDLFEDPPSELASLLSIATKECTDLAWLNISMQRFFYELSNSSTFYEKVKAKMVKKLSIAFSSGLLKRVRFKDVSFGSEAPYIKSIRAMSEDEIEELMERKDAKEAGFSKPAYFKQVYLLISMEYTATDNCIYIDADLIKGYSIPIFVKLQPFKGDLVLRMPANNYSTRLEISFIKNPGFDFSVEASFSKNDSAFFSNTLSHVIKRVCKYVAKAYVFPNWYYYYMPMLVSRSKVIQYSYFPIIGESVDGPMHQVREIQNLFSLDFAIITKKGNIIFRKTKSTVNTSNTPMERAEIEILNKPSILNDLFAPSSGTDIFSDVISDYEGTKVVQKFSEEVEKVHIIISNGIYEFIRITLDDMIIYQRTDPEEPQFIALRKGSGCITIIQYVNPTEPFYLGRFRITKLAKKLEKREMKVLGSAKLFKILDYSVKQAEKTKKIFGKKPKADAKGQAQNFTKDSTKEKYISDGYSVSSAPSSISEVSIIESHFMEIETKLEREEALKSHRIELPYAQEEISEALSDSLIRSAVFGSFSIMEDILLTETIRNTSMAQAESGQYVQMLSYSSPHQPLVIERILLSEEHQGVTAAIKVSTQALDIYVFGSEAERSFRCFTELIVAALEKIRVLKMPRVSVGRAYAETLKNSSGFVLSADAPVPCAVSVEIGRVPLFSEDFFLKSPFVFTFSAPPGVEMRVVLKPRKKAGLEMCIIPHGSVRTAESLQGVSQEIRSSPEERAFSERGGEGESTEESADTSSEGEETPPEPAEVPAESEKTPNNPDQIVTLQQMHVEGDLCARRRGKFSLAVGRGFLYWRAPWSTSEKARTEETAENCMNGAGYAYSEVPAELQWRNAENKDVTKRFSVGFISK
ncbi:uncharacterized protein NEMAJ01_2253 [Nematocida major]|uniref:uncharacterized protein n=1 Tax=Nematocida major TaxID=1912982 RepID=UPI002007AB84|nr:uncharacterized protein NEMAJ01_2253 [Nematocida major]KAH9387357.1 hypothetical protein NEMAJ01_2253 [Nematocida major]